MRALSRRFGRRLRSLRRASGRSLRAVAAAADITPGYLSQVERGNFGVPSEETIRRIAVAIGADHDDLLAVSGRLPARVVRFIQRGGGGITNALAAAADAGAPAEDVALAVRVAGGAGRRT